MIETNIKEFLAAARSYLLDLLPTQHQNLATAPIRRQP